MGVIVGLAIAAVLGAILVYSINFGV